MKTVFDPAVRQEIIDRLDQLTVETRPLWGKMSPSQMVKHCRLWEEMIHENKIFRRPLIGRLIGPMILKKVLQASDFRKNSPSVPEMVVIDTDIDLDEERRRLVMLVDGYQRYDHPDNSFVHPFFGKMTREQTGRFAYIHLNHHLKQFSL